MLTLKLIVAAARCDIASIRLSHTHSPSLRSPMGVGHLSAIWLGAGYRNRRRNDPRHRPNGHNPSTPGLRVRPCFVDVYTSPTSRTPEGQRHAMLDVTLSARNGQRAA